MLKGTKVFAVIGTALLLFSLAFIFIKPSQADSLIAKGPNISVTLVDDQCTSQKVAKAHPDKDITKGSKAIIVFQGKMVEACWILDEANSSIYLIDETGDEGELPISAFKVQPSI